MFEKPLRCDLPKRKEHADFPVISVDEIVYRHGTIYKHITRSREEIRDLREATGSDINELVVFKPERVGLHECIVQASPLLDLSVLLEKLLAPNVTLFNIQQLYSPANNRATPY